jgi:hypothetical protein
VVAFPIASWAFEPVDTDANKAADTSDKIQERLCISDTPQGTHVEQINFSSRSCQGLFTIYSPSGATWPLHAFEC